MMAVEEAQTLLKLQLNQFEQVRKNKGKIDNGE